MLREVPPIQRSLWVDLSAVRNAALYRAPEMQRADWDAGALCLSRHFGRERPTQGWAATIVDIWTGKTPIEPTA
jgi:hypothetical protein